MDLGLRDKACWVAGSSRGIGFAIAAALAGEGARVALGARNEDALADAALRLEKATGRRPFTHALDMGSRPSIAAWTAACKAATGPAAVLVSNSGGPPAGRSGELSPEQWHAAAELLLHGAVSLVEEVQSDMRAQGWGRILFVTSVSVRQPIDGLVLSNALRPAVQGYARSLANELGAAGITVNCVAPGYTLTERLTELIQHQAAGEGQSPQAIEDQWRAQIPLGRLGKPEEIAAAALWLAGDSGAYVTGQLITVDGGLARSLY